ncbi:MAG: PIF1 family ATP-dependent DNA helicase [Patescibacteria group bacterium]
MWWIWFIAIAGFLYYFFGRNNDQPTTYKNTLLRPIKPRLNEKQIDISNIELSDEQKKLFDLLEKTNNNVFVTGKAGTGKSVLLQYFKQNSQKRLVVLAPTGVAALNVGGQTIHSFFRIPPSFVEKKSLSLNYRVATVLRNVDTIVIDEISMVRADLMEAIDDLLRQARGNQLPFGGVQLVMFGDLYQLPPVVGDPELHKYFQATYGGFYFFNADVWKDSQLDIYELTHIFRQDDQAFKDILNAFRSGKVEQTLLDTLNIRSKVQIPEQEIVNLVTTNQLVYEINDYHLEKLNEKLHEYRASIFGNLEQSAFPTEEILRLKKGAQVMLLKNDREKRWVNGSIGIVQNLLDGEIKVNIDGFTHTIPQETWNKIRYYYNQNTKKVEEEVVSSFTQFPLRLAWAMTIHKAQGKTLGSVVVDMGDGAFAHGQTYVALSRCKSLEGLYLKRDIAQEDIIVDPAIVTFMDKARIIDITKYDQKN